MKTRLRLTLLSSAIATALAACGGGGGGGGGGVGGGDGTVPDVPGGPSVPTTTSVPVTVIDGPIQGALVCLDVSNNGACEDSEPHASTDASGKATLDVPNESLNKFPVVAMVGPDAVDAATGRVTTPYRMKAPADATAVVSPYSTLVERLAEKTGASTAQADASLRTQLALSGSLLADYTADADKRSAIIASMLVQIAQKMSTALASSVGKSDASGGLITTADVSREISNSQLDKLGSIRAMADTPEARAACSNGTGGADCITHITGNANYWVTTPIENRVDNSTIATAVGISKLIADAPADALPANPADWGALKFLTITDANNWYVNANVATAAESTPVNGFTRFRQQRARATNGNVVSWGYFGNPASQEFPHWSGSGWVTCPATTPSTRSLPDARGVRTSNVCDGYVTGVQKHAEVDISGKSMAEFVNMLKSYPYRDTATTGTPFAQWGPTGSAAEITASLGTRAFPAGSKVVYGAHLDERSAPIYSPAEDNAVSLVSIEAAAGGDARVNPGLACNQTTVNVLVASLEEMIAKAPGKPCIFNPGSIVGAGGAVLGSGDRNETWGLTTVSLGANTGNAPIGTASTATSYYTGNIRYRVSFAGGGSTAVTFFQCQERAINASTRNCDAVGTGTYAITPMGDARVMTFSDVPGLSVFKGVERAFVERGGKVYYGSMDKTISYNVARPNLVAGNAILDAFASLGVVGLTRMTP